MASKNVVTSVQTKTASGYDTEVLFGVQQRYVGPLLNSHNNNLEEQFVLGLDCVTSEWDDSANNTHMTVKKYYDGSNAPNGYYMMISKNYGENGKSENVVDYGQIPVSGDDSDWSQGSTDGVIFLESSHAVWETEIVTDPETGEEEEVDLNRLFLNAELVAGSGVDYFWSADGFRIDPGLIIMEENTLYFRTRANVTTDDYVPEFDIKVAKKEMKQKIEGDPDSGETVIKRTTEIITPYLS